MNKTVESKSNFAGGIDLLTERDTGNLVLILTGNPSRSLDFWEQMLFHAQTNVERLRDTVEHEQ